MQVDSRKIKVFAELGYRGVESLPDGSVRCIIYKKQEPQKQLLEMKKYYDNEYRLQVNLPPEREVDKVIIVARSSANCYRVVLSDTKRVQFLFCKTYDEISNVLKQSLSK